jgi:hypothetical protein
MTIRRLSLAAALGLALVAAGCHNEDLFTPVPPGYAGGVMFVRYVSLGNSLTAGFQSGGINDSTQKQSYAVLMAGKMGGDPFYRPSFNYIPALNLWGCPPPIDSLFGSTGAPHRLGGATAPPCSLRSAPLPPYVSNVAVPGATVFDPFHAGPTPSANALTLFILGGRSQVEAAAAAQPTFVSVWIGNNDVLAAATDTANAGNPAEVTDTAVFRARYDSLLAALDVIGTIKGGILIGVADVAAIPYFSYGQVYYGAFAGGKLPPQMTVLLNCAPPPAPGGIGDTVLVPFQYGFGLIGKAQAGIADTLDCTNNHNIEPAELAKIHATVATYNGVISARATARNWAYADPNPALAALRTGADTSQVRIFPYVPPDTAAVTRPFGRAFSKDGIHPSAATHKLIANLLIQTINAKYSSAIPLVP